MYVCIYIYEYITLYTWGVYIKDGVGFVERTYTAKCLYICIHIYFFVCICIYIYRSVHVGGIYGEQGGVRGEKLYSRVPVYVWRMGFSS